MPLFLLDIVGVTFVTVVARTRTSTSSAFGAGRSTSSSRRTSGRP
jgi:hypothetical protein